MQLCTRTSCATTTRSHQVPSVGALDRSAGPNSSRLTTPVTRRPVADPLPGHRRRARRGRYRVESRSTQVIEGAVGGPPPYRGPVARTREGEVVGSAPVPPLPYRARPSQLLLVVGAVLVVSAGGAAAAVYGGGSARVLLLALAAAAAGCSAWGSRARLRATEEVLAAAAVALAVLGTDAGAPLLRGSAAPSLVLGGVFLVLARLLRRPATWPLAAWLALQLAALRALDGSEAGVVRTAELLTVALVGLGVA